MKRIQQVSLSTLNVVQLRSGWANDLTQHA